MRCGAVWAHAYLFGSVLPEYGHVDPIMESDRTTAEQFGWQAGGRRFKSCASSSATLLLDCDMPVHKFGYKMDSTTPPSVYLGTKRKENLQWILHA